VAKASVAKRKSLKKKVNVVKASAVVKVNLQRIYLS